MERERERRNPPIAWRVFTSSVRAQRGLARHEPVLREHARLGPARQAHARWACTDPSNFP